MHKGILNLFVLKEQRKVSSIKCKVNSSTLRPSTTDLQRNYPHAAKPQEMQSLVPLGPGALQEHPVKDPGKEETAVLCTAGADVFKKRFLCPSS